jgi:hypothetical protein
MKSVIIPAREAIKLECQRCRHEWLYTGASHFVCCCPSCKTTVTILKKRDKKENRQADSQNNSSMDSDGEVD